MSLVQTLRQESKAQLRARILAGHPVDPTALEGWAYRGTSLGLPRFVEKLTWKTFQKTFWREPATGRLLGWNVRLEQDGVDAPSRPRMKRGAPVTTWHYEVVEPRGVAMPRGFDRGLIIDYGRAKNAALDTIRVTKDPLVAVEPGNADLLLGVSYLALGPVCLETPTYFLLEREHPLTHVPGAARSAPLFAFERRWAELLFDAVLGTGEPGGLPSLRSLDNGDFWHHLAKSTPPYFGPGLRATVHALTFLPVTMAGFRKPLFALSREARLACVEQLEASSRTTVRQLLATAKILACFALFEDDGVRRSMGGRS
ncbi:MAG: hypothetical protein Q8L48_32655 [Archangium sp.]|nr:hypothetical protein [Archangium sp.]